MTPKLVELRPDRNLLNSNFEGYKLSLATLPVCEKSLPVSIDRAAPDGSQYSLLHAKLYGLHNHIFAEEIHGVSYIYFVDKDWNVWKLYVEPFLHRFIEPVCVWKIPKNSSRHQGQYNITLKFVTSQLVVLSTPSGILYILNTGDRSLDVEWNVVFENKILGTENKFVIQDALSPVNDMLYLLLLRIDQDTSGEHWINFLNWIVISFNENEWSVVANRELKAGGELYYSYFEPDGTALYVSSEKNFKFTENKAEDFGENEEKKKYVWSQTKEDVTVRFKLPGNYDKKSLKITTKLTEIFMQYENNVLLSGTLYGSISDDLTTWSVKNNIFEIVLTKREEGKMWPELVVGDNSGEFIADFHVVDEIHQKLSNFCSDSEENPLTGTTFNSQQVEECDFVNEGNCTLERISWDKQEVTHRVNMGTNHVILTVQVHEGLAPALGLRHDVDVCLYQPYKDSSNDWQLKHEGTLLAFGYVQASKQQKKFVSCTPDFSHAVVCESSRHIFVYCQDKPIANGALRNRSTGENVRSVAEQRVISLDNCEILGVYLSNSELFILTQDKIYCFSL